MIIIRCISSSSSSNLISPRAEIENENENAAENLRGTLSATESESYLSANKQTLQCQLRLLLRSVRFLLLRSAANKFWFTSSKGAEPFCGLLPALGPNDSSAREAKEIVLEQVMRLELTNATPRWRERREANKQRNEREINERERKPRLRFRRPKSIVGFSSLAAELEFAADWLDAITNSRADGRRVVGEQTNGSIAR